jgi:hypothetical protein
LLYGAGTITGNVNNNGTVAPGNSPGTLTIAGNYVQGAAGALNVELGGTGAGQYDVLNVTGTVTLAGTLNVSMFGGFTGSVGDVFNVITAGSVLGGTFGSLNYPGGYAFTANYLPVAFSLQLNTVGAPPIGAAALNSAAMNETVRELSLLNLYPSQTLAKSLDDPDEPDCE